MLLQLRIESLMPGPGCLLETVQGLVQAAGVPILVLVKLDDVVGPAVLDIAGWLHYVPACVVG